MHARRHSCALEDNIHLAYTIDLADGLCGLFRDRQVLVDIFSPLHWHKVACVSKSIVHREIKPSLVNVGNDDLLRTLDLRNSRTQQTHSASTVHHHSRILGHQATSEGMQRDTKRLKQGADVQTHILGQLVTPLCRVVDPLLQRSLEVREALATAPELQLFANVVPAL